MLRLSWRFKRFKSDASRLAARSTRPVRGSAIVFIHCCCWPVSLFGFGCVLVVIVPQESCFRFYGRVRRFRCLVFVWNNVGRVVYVFVTPRPAKRFPSVFDFRVPLNLRLGVQKNRKIRCFAGTSCRKNWMLPCHR